MDSLNESQMSIEQDGREEVNHSITSDPDSNPFASGADHHDGERNSNHQTDSNKPKKTKKLRKKSTKRENEGELHRHSKKIRKTKAIRPTPGAHKKSSNEEISKQLDEIGPSISETMSATKLATFHMNQKTPSDSNPSAYPTGDPQAFYKTKMCAHLNQGGCSKGDKCTFAHSLEELRHTPDLKKTKLCQLYESGKCQAGEHCQFAHGEAELKSTPDFYKTALCQLYAKGNCVHGAKCRFAHGEKELRPLPQKRDFWGQNKGYPPMGPGGPHDYYGGYGWGAYPPGPRMGMPGYDPMAMMPPMDYGYMPGYYPPPQYGAPPYYNPSMPPSYPAGTTPYPTGMMPYPTYPPN